MVVAATWNKYGMRSHAERGNEIKSVLVFSFPRSRVGMHICVMNILLPAVLEKLLA